MTFLSTCLHMSVAINQTIIKSTSVTFPEGKDVPKVSDKAREFIRKALAYACSRYAQNSDQNSDMFSTGFSTCISCIINAYV